MSERTESDVMKSLTPIVDALIRGAKAEALREAADDADRVSRELVAVAPGESLAYSNTAHWLRTRALGIESGTEG